MQNDFLTLTQLVTFGGTVLGVSVLTELFKDLIFREEGEAKKGINKTDNRVRLFVYILSVIFVFALNVDYRVGLEGILLGLVNAGLVTFASLGGYEVVKEEVDNI